ncbi:hypothetical protein [Taklimakanibacter deserti]|uniref:hypothetical protein n=1 Tax=Taklimakanibacter deserti TaxID=2267839 RepID=UPI000E64AD34
MFRAAIAVLLLAAALAGPSAAEKKTAPKLTQEAKDGPQITQENIVKMKLKTVQPVQPNPPMPVAGGPSIPPSPSPPNP